MTSTPDLECAAVHRARDAVDACRTAAESYRALGLLAAAALMRTGLALFERGAAAGAKAMGKTWRVGAGR